MTAIPAAGAITSRTGSPISQGTYCGYLDNIVSVLNELMGGAGQSATTQLSSNTFTPTNNLYAYQIETNGAGASDTLNLITPTNIRDGQIILIRSTNNTHVITVTNGYSGTGSILTADGNNITMNNTKLFIALKYNLSITSFEEVFRSIPISSGSSLSLPTYGGTISATSHTAVGNYWYDINLSSNSVVSALPDATTIPMQTIAFDITTGSSTYGHSFSSASSQTIDGIAAANFDGQSAAYSGITLRAVNGNYRTECRR